MVLSRRDGIRSGDLDSNGNGRTWGRTKRLKPLAPTASRSRTKLTRQKFVDPIKRFCARFFFSGRSKEAKDVNRGSRIDTKATKRGFLWDKPDLDEGQSVTELSAESGFKKKSRKFNWEESDSPKLWTSVNRDENKKLKPTKKIEASDNNRQGLPDNLERNVSRCSDPLMTKIILNRRFSNF